MAYSRLFEVTGLVRFLTTAVTFGLAGMLAHYDLAAPSKLAIFTLSMALTGPFLLLAMMAAA